MPLQAFGMNFTFRPISFSLRRPISASKRTHGSPRMPLERLTIATFLIMVPSERVDLPTNGIKESTKTLYNIIRKSNKKLIHLNTVQFQTKRSDNSQQPLIRSNTNSVVQSPIETLKRSNLIKNLDVNDSNLNISKTNININMNNFNTNINNSINNNNSINEIANSSISLSFNNSLFNSKTD